MEKRRPSLQARVVKTLLKIKPHTWARGSIIEQRNRQEKLARWALISNEVQRNPVNFNGIPGELFRYPDSTSGVILYLHGGAYALGSAEVHRSFLCRLAKATRLEVLAINYRLAPEHPFPAALDDAVDTYRWLLSENIPPERIVIAGDSAGGGLALATIAALRDSSDPLPACVFCLSPWVDLTLSCKSIDTHAERDSILSRAVLSPYADFYAGDHKKDHPLISPLFADLAGFPPLLIHVGSDEILFDEAHQLADAARAAGVEVEIQTWEWMFHVFQIVPFLPEANQSLYQAAHFIKQYLG